MDAGFVGYRAYLTHQLRKMAQQSPDIAGEVEGVIKDLHGPVAKVAERGYLEDLKERIYRDRAQDLQALTPDWDRDPLKTLADAFAIGGRGHTPGDYFLAVMTLLTPQERLRLAGNLPPRTPVRYLLRGTYTEDGVGDLELAAENSVGDQRKIPLKEDENPLRAMYLHLSKQS